MSKRQRRTAPHTVAATGRAVDQNESRVPVDVATLQDEPITASAELQRLSRMGDAVAELGLALGIFPDQVAEGEALERLEVTTRLSVNACAEVEPERVANWFGLFGADLTLDLRVEGLDPDAAAVTVALRADRNPKEALCTFVASARQATTNQGDEVVVEARLALAKTRALDLARTVAARTPDYAGSLEMRVHTTVAVFYCAAAWNRLITLTAVPLWEQARLVRDDGRACIVLCDASGHLAGVALDVIGAGMRSEPDWLSITRTTWRRFIERTAEMRQLCAEESTWPNAPRVLTPDHLRLSARHAGLESAALRLARLRGALAACYLASVVQGGFEDRLTLRFGGPRPSICHLQDDMLMEPNQEGEIGSGALVRLASWAYQSASADKLAIARECLARELPPGRDVTFEKAEQAAISALEASKANFVLYVRSQTERYFASRQTAQEAVADYAETVRKAVTDLTGDVVDNVYRTVGLLVAVVIAGLIQPPALTFVTPLAAILYTLYLVFVLAFLMRARHDRFQLEAAALHARLNAMPELTASERRQLQQPASAADDHFQRYFRLACGIYAALLVAGVIAAILFLVGR
ncbi:MAG TPA: hypothetical protein VGP82_12260 [Ktedonobacterales bacterium]|jgi:hypothetical protein|nr:hypothetical protein [Ktedonobacterales bacterium]